MVRIVYVLLTYNMDVFMLVQKLARKAHCASIERSAIKFHDTIYYFSCNKSRTTS